MLHGTGHHAYHTMSTVKTKFHYAIWFEAKFHYTIWFEAGLKLVADLLARVSLLPASYIIGQMLARCRSEPASNLSATSFEPHSVMEFGLNRDLKLLPGHTFTG